MTHPYVDAGQWVTDPEDDEPAPSPSPAPDGDLDDLFQRLDEILIEESPMHPFGCSTWEEASRVAINMAKDEITRLRAAVSTPVGDLVERVDFHRAWLAHQLLDTRLSDEEAYSIVAFFPAVKPLVIAAMQPVGWRDMESAPKDGTLVDLWANGHRYPDAWWTGYCWKASISDCVAADDIKGATNWQPLPAPPGVGS